MPKTTGPLFSMSASGQLGHAVVYLKNGYARSYVVPANPNTTDQQAVRNILHDVQKEVKTMGLVLRGELKTGFGSRWTSMVISELMADNHARWDALLATFTALGGTDKGNWATADTISGPFVADGAPLYIVATAITDIAARLGLTIDLTVPAATNSSTVATDWGANS